MEKKTENKNKGDYKTPAYTRAAAAAYRSRNKQITLSVPNDIYNRAVAVGLDSASLKALYIAEIEKREKQGV